MKVLTSPYFYIPVIIVVLILLYFWFRYAVLCERKCNFWTGKPKSVFSEGIEHQLPDIGLYQWDNIEKKCYQNWMDDNKTWVADNKCAGH